MLVLRRSLGLALGFLATTLVARWSLEPRSLTLAEPHVNEVRAELLSSYAGRPEREDVLLLGSSRVRAGLDARIVQEGLRAQGERDVTVYKLGVAGLRPPLLLELLEDLVAHRPPRRLLVVGLEIRLFARPEGVVGEWDKDVGEAAFWRGFRGLRGLWHLPWAFSSRTERINAMQQQMLGQRMPDERRQRAEEQVLARRAGDQVDNLERIRWAWPEPGDGVLVAFDRCLDRLAELPCEVVFVRLPMVAGFEQRVLSDMAERFRATVLPRLAERGWRYLDLDREPYPQDAADFVDQTHLTMAGCAKASRELARDLAKVLAE